MQSESSSIHVPENENTEIIDYSLNKPKEKIKFSWILDVVLILILITGAYLRFVGINWGEYTYMHPDERFLVMVGSSLEPVKSIGEYFDTAHSSLNPHNKGYGFFVYGTFPIFLARYMADWVFHSGGMQELIDVGRPLSAFFDLLTVLLVYLISIKAYNRRIGILASAFTAFLVLPIQLSHFFKEDTFLNFFVLLSIYFALRIIVDGESPEIEPRSFVFLFIWFGIAFGLAVACKLNAVPIIFILPVAVILRIHRFAIKNQRKYLSRAIIYLILSGLISIIVFRIAQPYAFSGPGFLGINPNPLWMNNIREQRAQADGDVDFPPAMQWARRPIWFAGENMVVWGMGMPLGMLACAGFLWIGWNLIQKRIFSSNIESLLHRFFNNHKDGEVNFLLWLWVAFYFIWQSISFNPTMRYLLPIYPILTLFAAWVIFQLWDSGILFGYRIRIVIRFLTVIVGISVLTTTIIYAFSFTSVYSHPFTRVDASRWIYQNIPGPINLHIRMQGDQGIYNQPLPFSSGNTISIDKPYLLQFMARQSGILKEISFHKVWDQENSSEEKIIHVSVSEPIGQTSILSEGTLSSKFIGQTPREYVLTLDKPITLRKGANYLLSIKNDTPTGSLNIEGATIANEGDWDDGLPLRVDDYDGFGGVYPVDVNFQMYWDDNPDKLSRFLNILDRSEYIVISSNRQWGTLPRIPERFPLVTTFYRNLLGCPSTNTVEWCYRVSIPAMFNGNLGFELVKIFQSDPSIGRLNFNDQFAEEAFTVYDHPKVFILKKTKDYNSQKVKGILGAVDFSHVLHVTPKKAASYPMDIMLPADRLAEQRIGGTWSTLFDPDSPQNRFEPLGVLLWYLSIFLLGIIVYPLTRLAFCGLSDYGYPLTRSLGLIFLAYIVWIAGSNRIAFNRWTITTVIAFILILGVILAYLQRKNLILEWKERKKYYLMIEVIALAAFLFFLFIRWGNPDLWHPWKGGEKPMDFSYFNAVIKSTSFPPYDPWFAGGYINYYYYGFVIAAVFVKLLGIVPAFAYNLIIPTIFSLIVLGAFSVGWNLRQQGKWLAGCASALGVALLGNLGTWRMIFRGWQMLIAPNGQIENIPGGDVSILVHWSWAIRGLLRSLAGESLPYNSADWYWIPSRAIASMGDVEPITEFPYFTVLYADLHAHLFSLPITLLALAWAISAVKNRAWKIKPQETQLLGYLKIIVGLLVGGLAIGALRPTNTWDFPTYLLIGVIAIGFGLWRYHCDMKDSPNSETWTRYLYPVFLVVLAFFLYQPFSQWYAQAYTSVDFWNGPRTSFSDYLTHWGLFLFLIVTWMFHETIDWMAATPLSYLRKLLPYKTIIWILCSVTVLVMVTLGIKLPSSGDMANLPFGFGSVLFSGVQIAWFVLPMGIWTIILLLRSGQSDEKRITLFMIGTALALTLFVEIIVLRGDIGRMNTVFKFYLQAWILFGISAAMALGWMLDNILNLKLISNKALPSWVLIWEIGVILLVICAALYPIMATPGKFNDRMVQEAPRTLDGMAYMQYAHYNDQNMDMDLSQDYTAIRWMQDNIIGSPVIVEGNVPEYRWGTRYTIYTGLPGVVGWNWHQRQQRGIASNEWVTDRVAEVSVFYQGQDLDQTEKFLNKYQVSYIVLGQLERAYYPGSGLDKFPANRGKLWEEVYRNGKTTIYKVVGR